MTPAQLKRAQELLTPLTQGLDPTNPDRTVPDSDIVNRIDVQRALLVALAVMEEATARSARRAMRPKNVGKPLTETEEEELRAAFQGGGSLEVIAKFHGRSVRSIESRLVKLGLLSPAERTTANFGMSQAA
jgi:hypothetical protein